MRTFVFLFALCAVPLARGQDVPVGSCERGEAVEDVETDALSFIVRTDGQLFYDTTRPYGEHRGYVVPVDLGVPTVFAASLWLTGYVGDSLRTAARIYQSGDLWPGPLADADAPPADCSAYDRIWTVRRADVERYLETGEATDDLREWPHEAGAPVLDGDGVQSNYDLAAGDQPDLHGDVAAYWVMNDAGNAHGTPRPMGETAPLGVEVRALAFAFERSPFDAVSDETLRHTGFFRFEVTNRRHVPIDSLRFSLFVDVDLGNFNDDYVGTDTLRNVAYVYNGDNVDDEVGENRHFGPSPPAWGVQVLRGPVGLPNGRDDDFDGDVDEPDERLRLSTAPPVHKSAGTRIPTDPQGFVNVQRGRRREGPRLGAYGWGWTCNTPECDGHRPTVFAYPADAALGTFWSERNPTGSFEPHYPGDRMMVATVGAVRLAPGETATYELATPFARGRDHIDSVLEFQDVTRTLQAAFADGVPSRPVPPPPVLPDRLALAPVRPNPVGSGGGAVLSLPSAEHVEAVVVDALGRRGAVVSAGTMGPGETELRVPGGLAPGAYVLRVRAGADAASVPFVVAR